MKSIINPYNELGIQIKTLQKYIAYDPTSPHLALEVLATNELVAACTLSYFLGDEIKAVRVVREDGKELNPFKVDNSLKARTDYIRSNHKEIHDAVGSAKAVLKPLPQGGQQ